MPCYRKKPILVEARRYTGDNFLELQDWSAEHVELSDYRDDAICVHVTGIPHYDDDIDYGGVRREIENRPESHFCFRTDELIDRVVFSGERA